MLLSAKYGPVTLPTVSIRLRFPGANFPTFCLLYALAPESGKWCRPPSSHVNADHGIATRTRLRPAVRQCPNGTLTYASGVRTCQDCRRFPLHGLFRIGARAGPFPASKWSKVDARHRGPFERRYELIASTRPMRRHVRALARGLQ